MSRRESAIKAVAVALQPKGFEIPYRKTNDRVVRAKPDDAAGALAFASMPRELAGEMVRGDTFQPLLLRLKYAEQWNRRFFLLALARLLERRGGLVRRGGRRIKMPSETMYAVALTALFEWVHDTCPKCRDPGSRVAQPIPCPACRFTQPKNPKAPLARRENVVFERAGKRIERTAARLDPASGCPTCAGLGRVFPKLDAGHGMVCLSCRNSGRKAFPAKQRWRLVSDYLADAARGRGHEVIGFPYQAFATLWAGRYQKFLDELRRADKNMAEGVDLRIRPWENRAAEEGTEEQIDEPILEPASPTAGEER